MKLNEALQGRYATPTTSILRRACHGVRNFLPFIWLLHSHSYEDANLAYHVIITEVNNSHTVVQPIWTSLLKVQAFGGLINHSKLTFFA